MRHSVRGLVAVLASFAALCACCSGADGDLWQHTRRGPNDLLTAAQAFRLVSAQRGADRITVTFDIAPGYYLYRQRLHFAVAQPAGSRLASPELPAGDRIAAVDGTTAEIYRGPLQARLHWLPGSAPEQLQISFQGCAEAGVCYPPQTALIAVAGQGH
jgi:thiol:disulfide interchange protein DsbD